MTDSSRHPANTHRPSRLPNRRDALSFGVTVTAGICLGCNPKPEIAPVTDTAPARTDIPLRVVLSGSERDRDAVRHSWAAVSEQPLEIELIEFPRDRSAGSLDQLTSAAKSADVVVYPVLAMGQLSQDRLLTPFSDEELESTQEEGRSFYAALRNSVVRYGSENTALPLGAVQPAIVLADQDQTPDSWQAYDEWVESVNGAAAEPLAAGWAAAMYLWRASAAADGSWLFRREDFAPLVDSGSYVESLQQMRATAQRYQGPRRSPEQIWKELKSGQLQGAVVAGGVEQEGDLEFQISDPPSSAGLPRVLLDVHSPVVSLSASCRQSAAAKQFIRWLAISDESSSVRKTIPNMTSTFPARTSDTDTAAVETNRSGYEIWLDSRLRIPNTLPTLQILAADEYYSVLDQQVLLCLDGDSEPEQALAEVAKQWQAITSRIGASKQGHAWRRAQGMLA